MTEHEYWDELAAGYALHCLSADEEQAFVAHLAGCPECAGSVKDHELVAAQLGSIAHYRDPDHEAPSWESMRAAVIGADGDELSVRRRRYDVSRRVLAAAAAAVVLAGGGIAAWQLTSGGSTRCTASAGCHAIELVAGGEEAAHLTVRGTTVTMTTTGMSAAPAGEVYVLWQQPRDGRPAALRTFDVSASRPVTAHLRAPYGDTQLFGVSLERAATAPPPSPSNIIASGNAT